MKASIEIHRSCHPFDGDRNPFDSEKRRRGIMASTNDLMLRCDGLSREPPNRCLTAVDECCSYTSVVRMEMIKALSIMQTECVLDAEQDVEPRRA